MHKKLWQIILVAWHARLANDPGCLASKSKKQSWLPAITVAWQAPPGKQSNQPGWLVWLPGKQSWLPSKRSWVAWRPMFVRLASKCRRQASSQVFTTGLRNRGARRGGIPHRGQGACVLNTESFRRVLQISAKVLPGGADFSRGVPLHVCWKWNPSEVCYRHVN